MPPVQQPDRTRLEQLRDRFHDAACTHPCVDAVVVFEPEVRHRDTVGQLRQNRVRPRDHSEPTTPQTDVSQVAAVVDAYPAGTFDPVRAGMELDEWIQPNPKNISQLGSEPYRSYFVLGSGEAKLGVSADRTLWQSWLFGPPRDAADDTAPKYLPPNAEVMQARRLMGIRSYAESHSDAR
jgi:hypothetical protein